jgi:hypothetical protein
LALPCPLVRLACAPVALRPPTCQYPIISGCWSILFARSPRSLPSPYVLFTQAVRILTIYNSKSSCQNSQRRRERRRRRRKRRRKKKKKIIIITFPVVDLLTPVAAIGALTYLSPFKYALLLRYAVSTYEYTISIFSFISLALYLYSSPTLLLRGAV